MIELGIMFGLMVAIAVVLIVKLMRRRGTENVDGLLIEQARRAQAYNDRVSYNSYAVHNSPPTMSDLYYRP
ncbi:hypothetical protein [Streptomyces sp. NPDC001070]